MTSSKSPANVTSNIAAGASSKDALLDATPDAAAVLSEEELSQVSGGTNVNQDVTVTKMKSATKAHNATMGYIKG
jgi:bacteriocin-like protein